MGLKIQHRRQFPVVIERFHIINELVSLFLGIGVAAEEMIGAAQQSGTLGTEPVVVEGGILCRKSLRLP